MSMNQMIDILLTHAPALIIAVPLLGAFLTPLVSKIHAKLRNVFVIIVLAVTEFFVLLLASDVFTNGLRIYVFGAGSPSLATPAGYSVPVRILFEIDGMSIFMAIIGATLALIAVIYSWAFMEKHDGLDKYYTLILLMTAGMLGMVCTGDLFNFFVFLEITSISSCALIAFWVHKGKALDAALKYLVISTIAALFVLFAIALLYSQYGSLNIATLASSLQYTLLDKVALVLLIAALGLKAGIVPMHMWLPDAYSEAPASVTLILVGATQVSLYAVFRVCFSLYGLTLNAAVVGGIIIALGVISILVGVTMALIQTDFKRLIAYSAIAEIGYISLGIGVGFAVLGSPEFDVFGLRAIQGGIFHIINDALDIGLLFLVAGALFYATKERVLDKMGGLARNMKYTSIFFIIGLLAVAGMPPMNGFASKLLIYESIYQFSPILSIIAILFSILLLAIFVKVFYAAFMGPQLPKFNGVKDVPKTMLLGMAILASIIIIFGLFPNVILESIVQPAAEALANQASYVSHVLGGI